MTMPQTDSPTTGFRPFFNPATGEWITYTAIAANSHGQLVRFNWRSVPGGVITEHIHPRQEERFTILAGEAHFTLEGEQRIARAGETVVVPAGVPHSEGNPGPGEIEGVVELRPALRAKEFHEALAGLVADGKTTPRGAPKNPLQLGATFWHAPAAMGPGQGLRHTPLLQPLGQPDLSSWPVPPPCGRRDLVRRFAGPLRDWDRYRTPISWALAMASWRVDTPSFR
jgi:quercetin dioxygenase-like cupin family protein